MKVNQIRVYQRVLFFALKTGEYNVDEGDVCACCYDECEDVFDVRSELGVGEL
jgi:hypothetical protein